MPDLADQLSEASELLRRRSTDAAVRRERERCAAIVENMVRIFSAPAPPDVTAIQVSSCYTTIAYAAVEAIRNPGN